MELFGVGQYSAVQSGGAPQRSGSAAPQRETPPDEKKAAGAGRDTVTLSGNADHLRSSQEQFPKMSFFTGTDFADRTVRDTGGSAAKALEAPQTQGGEEADEEESGDMSGVSGRVGINAAKLARMLAAAKTRAQVQAVIAKIEADLDECEAGKEQGMDVDEASVEAAESLLQEAKSRLAGAESREATPAEEMASALASLM